MYGGRLAYLAFLRFRQLDYAQCGSNAHTQQQQQRIKAAPATHKSSRREQNQLFLYEPAGAAIETRTTAASFYRYIKLAGRQCELSFICVACSISWLRCVMQAQAGFLSIPPCAALRSAWFPFPSSKHIPCISFPAVLCCPVLSTRSTVAG